MEDAQLVEEPVIQGSVIFKFERANRVGDSFDRIFKAVSPVIRRIDAPLIARAVMCCVEYAIHNRVSHVQVRRCHIYFCSQCAAAVLEFACPHSLE